MPPGALLVLVPLSAGGGGGAWAMPIWANAMSTQRNGGTVVAAALNFSQANATNIRVLSIPTQLELAQLRVGDVYVDTSASNVLKVKV